MLFLLPEEEGIEEQAIGVFWVTDGVDRCQVGFLPRHCLAHKADYDGKLAQVVEMHSLSEDKSVRERSHRMRGSCMAAMVENYQSE